MTDGLNLSVIGNCQIAVIVDQQGRYVWGCFPRYDSDPAFCSLLQPGGKTDQLGFFEIELENLVQSEQSYVENTAILRTTLTDESGGAIRIVDYAPRYLQYGRSYHPIMVVRHIVPLRGAPAIRIRLRPAADYGARKPNVTHGSNHIRFESGGFPLRLTTNAQLSAVLEERTMVLDKPVTLILGPDETIPEAPERINREMYGETRAYWEAWTRALSIPFEWQKEVIRAAITLKICTYEDSGAVLAALTTSIPEAPDSGRNWDYRFCWLRDSYYTVQALNSLGATKTMEEYLRYIFNIIAAHGEGEDLQPVYGISGEAELTERTVASLAGYRGMGPVRVGNDAYQQVQNDSYGAAVLAATQSFFDTRLVDRRGTREFEWLEALGQRATEIFDKPDAGIWEYRGRAEVHTYSSIMCWAACDRLARIAGLLDLQPRAKHWRQQAKRIKSCVLDQAWSDKRQSFVASFGNDHLDASLLTMADLGFVEPMDPRFLGTVAAIEKELRRGPYLFRYMSEDDFGAPVTAFNICTFWYINALASVGRSDEARELFENMLNHRTSQGLLSEDLDPVSGALWGNFPQTYSMVGVISAARRLSRSWEKAL
jgi:GH15 family glucan-1,4-alpha-glucosidase